MIVCAIDPSNKDRNGIVVLEDSDAEIGFDITVQKLCSGQQVKQTLDELPNNAIVVCEDISHMGMAVGRDVFETCFWIGEYRALCKGLGFPFTLIKRNKIKVHHCGSTKAKDSNIRASLIERFGYWGSGKTGLGTKKDPGILYGISGDTWSALAIGVYYWDTRDET